MLIRRPVYDQLSFTRIQEECTVQIDSRDDNHGTTIADSQCCKNLLRSRVLSLPPNQKSLIKCCASALLSFLPVVSLMRHYKWRKWLPGDVVAGISLGCVHIPLSMAYAILATLPPVYGLYSSFFPLVIYFLFGTSRHISIGTLALPSLLLSFVIEREIANNAAISSPLNTTESHISTTVTTNISLANSNISIGIGIAASVSFIAGIIQLLMGLCRLGVIATFIPLPFAAAFLAGASTQIVVSQLITMFGLRTYIGHPTSGLFLAPLTCYRVAANLPHTNPAEFTCWAISMILLIFIREFVNVKFKARMKVPVPAEFIVIVLASFVSYLAKLEKNFNVYTIKSIPPGLPAPQVPPYLYESSSYITEAVIIASICFLDSISMTKVFRFNYNYDVNNSQELIAYGLTTSISACFQCFAGAQQSPRTLLHESNGGNTQLANLISALVILLVCLVLGPAFEPLPYSTLSAILLCSLFPTFRLFRNVAVFWKLNKWDCAIWLTTYSSTLLIDMPEGAVAGIAMSLLSVLIRMYLTRGHLLVSFNNTDLFYAVKTGHKNQHSTADSIRIFRFETDLFFATFTNFKNGLFENTWSLPVLVKERKRREKLNRKRISLFSWHDKTRNNAEFSSNASGFSTDGGEHDLEVATMWQHNNTSTLHDISETHPQNGVTPSSTYNHLERPCQTSAPRTIILDCSCVNYVDFFGMESLKRLITDYREVGVTVFLAAPGKSLTEKFRIAELIDSRSEMLIYPSLIDAVKTAMKEHSSYILSCNGETAACIDGSGCCNSNSIEDTVITHL